MSTRALVRGISALLLIVAMAPRRGLSQSISESFKELSRETVKEFWRGEEPLMKAGDTIWITYIPLGRTEFQEQEARVVALTGETITMQIGDSELELPESRVSSIEWRRKESVVDGLMIGAAAGVGVGLLMAASVCEGGLFGADCDTGSVYAALGGIGGAVGSGLGALADRSKKSPPLLIYRAPGSTATAASFSVTVAPIISKARKGVVLSVAW